MKKLVIFCLITCFFTLALYSITGNRATVFLKNGRIEIFDISETKSMGLSTIDTLGNEKNHVVSQYFNVDIDSTKYIALEDIDSVIFNSENSIKPKATSVPISQELIDYIIDYDCDQIRLTKDTPSNLLPSVGEYIYYEGTNYIFPTGLCAQVKRIDVTPQSTNIQIIDAPLDMVYDEFIVNFDFDTDSEAISAIAEDSLGEG